MRYLANRTVQAILAFMPSVPNWAYNGAALGIGDFSNNAKVTPYGGWERPLQHYRAGVLHTDSEEHPCKTLIKWGLSKSPYDHGQADGA